MTTSIPTSEQVTDESQQLLLKKMRIFADFHNVDAEGRLRLNCIGTIDDFTRQDTELESGQEFTFYSEELEVDGMIEYSPLDSIWVAVIDWNKIRRREESDPELMYFNEPIGESLEIEETEYLLSTEANRQHLEEALEMLKNPHNYIYVDLNKL